MRVEFDGTSQGTKLYDDDEMQLHHVVAVQRVGRNTYVTTRFRDAEVDGANGDFALLMPNYARIRA